MNKDLSVMRNATKALSGRIAFQREGPEFLKAGVCPAGNSTKTNGAIVE